MNDNAQPVKIAFLLYRLGVGGSEKFSIALVNNLLNYNIIPIIILRSSHNPLISELDSRIKVIIIDQNGWNDKAFLNNLKNILRDENISKIFCLGVSSFYLAKRVTRSMRHVNFYVSLHSMKPVSFKDYLRNFLYVRLLSRKDHVIFICKNQRKYYRKAYLMGKVNDHVIYNGIDVDKFSKRALESEKLKQKEVIKDELGIPLKNEIILLLATLRIEKGHFYAIEALKILLGKYNNTTTHLLFVGGGAPDYIEQLKNKVEEYDLTDYVHFAGNQSEVRPYYNAADMFTLTSFGIETFSLAALEAMSYGLPCSLTNVGGASEMIIENETGLLSKPKDPDSIALTWSDILDNEFDRDVIRNRIIEEFSLKQMVENYAQLLLT